MLHTERHLSRWNGLAIVSALSGGVYYLLMIRLTQGNILNDYPFLSSDSYDWLYEGYVLSTVGSVSQIPTLPILRNPGFVSLTSIEYVLSGGGYFILAAIAASIFLMFYTLIRVAQRGNAPFVAVCGVLLLTFVSPLSFYRPFVLADQIACTFMIVSVAVGLRFFLSIERGQASRKDLCFLWAGGIIAIIGGLMQTYAIIPFLLIAALCLALRWRRKQDRTHLAVATICVSLLLPSIQLIWQSIIPHTQRPTQIGHLALSLDMAGFYFHVWIFAFIFLIPFVFHVLWKRRAELIKSPVLIGAWAATICLLMLTFFYQWEDFRLTMPAASSLSLALILTLREDISGKTPEFNALFITVPAIVGTIFYLSVAPATYWRPRLDELSVSPSSTWVAGLLGAEPFDRFRTHELCNDSQPICESAELPESLTGYQQLILHAFIEYVGPGSGRSSLLQ